MRAGRHYEDLQLQKTRRRIEIYNSRGARRGPREKRFAANFVDDFVGRDSRPDYNEGPVRLPGDEDDPNYVYGVNSPSKSNANWTQEVQQEEALWNSIFSDPEDWTDFRRAKQDERVPKNAPDFYRASTGDGVLVAGFFAPRWASGRLLAVSGDPPGWRRSADADAERLHVANRWKRLFEEPDHWTDYRALKNVGILDSEHADFVRAQTNEELRMADDTTPAWARHRVGEADRTGKRERGEETRYGLGDDRVFTGVIKNFFPEKGYGFIYCKTLKDLYRMDAIVNETHLRDFGVNDTVRFKIKVDPRRHMSPKAWGLEADEKRPTWSVAEAPKSELAWARLFADPEGWTDHRPQKEAGQLVSMFPDFVSDQGKALWLQDAPRWVADRVRRLADDSDSPSWQVVVPKTAVEQVQS